MDPNCKVFVCSQATAIFGVYFPSCKAMREINTKITLEWVHKQFIMRVVTSFHFLHMMNDDENDNLHTLTLWFTHSVYIQLMTSQSIANDVTKCFVQCNNCDMHMWKEISNSLDINVIHGHIQGLSCKKYFSIERWHQALPCQYLIAEHTNIIQFSLLHVYGATKHDIKRICWCIIYN